MTKVQSNVHSFTEDQARMPLEVGCPRFYIAGPFFNDPQRAIIQQIELWMVDNDIPFYSPRQIDNNKKPSLSDEDATQIFQSNVHAILQCGAVLAVLDWAMPFDQELRIVEATAAQTDPSNVRTIKSPCLNLPDSGTVWEMGFAFNRRPIYGFTLRQPGEKVNLMLTQCLEGVIYGWEDLRLFFNRGRVRPAYARKGEWKHR